jgi:5-hydroxyisourate hydrolase
MNKMISTHVLDTARGGPAAGITVILEIRHASEWSPVARGTTDKDGRATALTDGHTVTPGTYRLTFDTGTYLRDQGITHPFFPEAMITFQVLDAAEDFHLPLLLSPFGYCVYRGS